MEIEQTLLEGVLDTSRGKGVAPSSWSSAAVVRPVDPGLGFMLIVHKGRLGHLEAIWDYLRSLDVSAIVRAIADAGR